MGDRTFCRYAEKLIEKGNSNFFFITAAGDTLPSVISLLSCAEEMSTQKNVIVRISSHESEFKYMYLQGTRHGIAKGSSPEITSCIEIFVSSIWSN